MGGSHHQGAGRRRAGGGRGQQEEEIVGTQAVPVSRRRRRRRRPAGRATSRVGWVDRSGVPSAETDLYVSRTEEASYTRAISRCSLRAGGRCPDQATSPLGRLHVHTC